MMTINPTTDIIEFLYKFVAITISAGALIFGIYKFSMRNLDKKFEDQYNRLKANFDNIFIQHGARLESIQTEIARLNNLLSILVSEQKINNEDIARLKAEVLAIQATCASKHFWDGQTERRKDGR